jgi:uncharacterized protein (DUF2384 family)
MALAKRYIGDEHSEPLDSIDTEPGARAVEDVLGRIAYGGVS